MPLTQFRNTTGRLKRSMTPLPTSVISLKPSKQGRALPLRMRGDQSLNRQADPIIVKGPGEPPAGWSGAFPGGASRDEWLVYWALFKVLRLPGDPRRPPYAGGSKGNVTFNYQEPKGGGRLVRGGQVVDFEVTMPGRTIAIRLMTSRFHAEAKREQQVRDIRGKIELAKYQRVCDLWSQNFLDDPTGEAVCTNVADCIRGKENPDPFSYGSRRPRPKIQKAKA